MTWERRYRLKIEARTSLVLWASVSLLLALIAAPMVRSVDEMTAWRVFGFTPDGSRAVLGSLAGSMLTFIVFVLSATLIVVQLASGQMTPRVIATVFALPWVRVTLSVFTFTYTYTLSALARAEGAGSDLHVGVAVLLNLVCIVVFFLFIQRLSSGLRPSTLMRLVADQGHRVILQVYPSAAGAGASEAGAAEPMAEPIQVVRFTGISGVLMAFDSAGLVRLASSAEGVVELVPQVGDSVTDGDPLLRVYAPRPIPDGSLRGCVAIGPERTMEQDPRFAFRILVDIANKALSPAVNDPTTAVLALDQLTGLLHCLGLRRLGDGRMRDAAGKLRLAYGTPDWPDFVMLAVSEIRQYGKGSLQIDRRLRAMLVRLIRELPAERRPPLEQELALLGSSIARTYSDEEDRKRAAVADYQGVGGSES